MSQILGHLGKHGGLASVGLSTVAGIGTLAWTGHVDDAAKAANFFNPYAQTTAATFEGNVAEANRATVVETTTLIGATLAGLGLGALTVAALPAVAVAGTAATITVVGSSLVGSVAGGLATHMIADKYVADAPEYALNRTLERKEGAAAWYEEPGFLNSLWNDHLARLFNAAAISPGALCANLKALDLSSTQLEAQSVEFQALYNNRYRDPEEFERVMDDVKLALPEIMEDLTALSKADLPSSAIELADRPSLVTAQPVQRFSF